VEICSIDVQVFDFLRSPQLQADNYLVRQSRQIQRRRPHTLHPRVLGDPL
jgi:hypothetical protein